MIAGKTGTGAIFTIYYAALLMVLVEGLSVNERGTSPIFRGRPRAPRVRGPNELPSVAALRHMMRNVRYHDPSHPRHRPSPSTRHPRHEIPGSVQEP